MCDSEEQLTEKDNEKTEENKASPNTVSEKYKKTDKGSFVVMISKEKIHELSVGKHLKETDIIKNVTNITRINKDTCKISCKSWFAANNILSNQNLSKILKYKTYIPQNYIYSVGIVYDIPEEFEAKEILEASLPEEKLVKVERVLAWNRILQKEIPTKNMKVTFRTFELPSRVHFYIIEMLRITRKLIIQFSHKILPTNKWAFL